MWFNKKKKYEAKVVEEIRERKAERHSRKGRFKRYLAVSMAATITFTAVYALILNAITLDNNTASDMPGITWETEEGGDTVETKDLSAETEVTAAESSDEESYNVEDQPVAMNGDLVVVSDDPALDDETTAAGEFVDAGEPTDTEELTDEADDQGESVSSDVAAVAEETEDGEETPAADDETVGGAEPSSDSEIVEDTENTDNADDAENAENPDNPELVDNTSAENTELSDPEVDSETTEEDEAGLVAYINDEQPLVYEGEDYRITLTASEDAKVPADSALSVAEISQESEEYAAYLIQAREALGLSEDEALPAYAARFFDITILSNGEEVEPAASVKVEIALLDKKIKQDEDVQIVHEVEEGVLETPEVTTDVVKAEDLADSEIVIEAEEGEDVGVSASFETDSFSVYGVIYTVDFHWEVDGKVFDFSIPGGSFVSLQQLIRMLEIEVSSSASDETVKLNETDSDDLAKKFVADVVNVEFSSPELVWVGKIDDATTVGELKAANNLEIEYSAELTEEQIKEINAQTVEAGDWALISVLPFETEESLMITMKNGDQFVVKVTDALNPSIYINQKVIIYDNGEKRAMLSSGYRYENGPYRFNSIPLSEADGNEAAHWTVERNNNNFYLKSSDNRYLTINGTEVGLVNDWSVATALGIQAGTNPDYRIYAANNYDNVLTYEPNDIYDGYFSAPGGTYSGDNNTNRWLYIREVEAAPERAGDWLLYFDDDFSEITIHVGETISLRPYNKWEWKEGNVNVQTAHWNIGGKDNNYWNQIDINDSNGTHQDSWDDGGTGGTAGFHWTAYVKEDNQLNTHYWAVQGRATQTGDYILTNTKNGKIITVHVVDGNPVNKPQTINNIANIKVNLFDYDNGGELDVGLVNGETNHNLANDSNFKNESVNQMGGQAHFYFLSSGSGNNNSEPWNNYTADSSNPGIVQDSLNNGYPVLSRNQTSLQYLFDTSLASQSWHGGNGGDGMIAYPDVVGMFQKDNSGYYYFNSNTNYFYYDTATGTSKLYEHTYTQASGEDKGSLANDKPIGFFPFHDYDATSNVYVNQNAELNHHLGLSMDIEFMLSEDRLDDYGQPIIFDFSGDDDLWVFVEWEDEHGDKQSKLLLDLGGVHQPIHGNIDFTTGSNTQDIRPNQPYTLKVFYLERGGCDSNCSIRFNLPIIQDLAIAKKLTGLTEAEKERYKNEEFTYEMVVSRKPDNTPAPYTYPNPNNRYEKVTIWNADGEDITPSNFSIENGRFTLKAGETLTISHLDRSDKFTVAELNTSNMENFEVPNAERYYHQAHDGSLYEEEIHLTASTTLSLPVTQDWVTPEYTLENTEKVTFTNTLKEKNLEVEKKWIGEKDHPNSITFAVSATVDDGNGGRTPYAVKELKESNGITDKVFTLSDANHWRQEIEHLPVNTPDGKFIFYDISESNVTGYVLTGLEDLTADSYNYCNVDVVKLWPDSNGMHTEVLQVVLKNSEGNYYAGVDEDGKAVFTEVQELASSYELKPENNYSHRFARLPYGDYTAVQLHEDEYSKGLATYRRAIIQYELENTPIEGPVDPESRPNPPEIHKRIDALRDGVSNPDSPHSGEDLTDLYRLYLDYKVNSLQEVNGVDLLFVIDHSGSMNSSQWPGNEYRALAVTNALNGDEGLVSEFLEKSEQNQWAAVGFKGPDGSKDYTWSLSNPWEPKTAAAQSNAGQNGSEVLSGNAFSRSGANIVLDNEGASILSNYTAGFWCAEQFLLNQTVKEDGRKKVVVFITDGVPTLHIDRLTPAGSLNGAGTAAGSDYFREEYGGCPDKALTEFGYFVNDMESAGYTFGDDMEFYTIGLGASMQTESSANLLNGLLRAAYGETIPDNHFMTITDAADENDISTADKLKEDLRTILGLNEKFTNLVIQDDLSNYVDLYGIATAADIMKAAKAKVTMTIPGSSGSTVVLYENGASVDSDTAKFTKANGSKAPIIKELQYNAETKTIKAVFDPDYQALKMPHIRSRSM